MNSGFARIQEFRESTHTSRFAETSHCSKTPDACACSTSLDLRVHAPTMAVVHTAFS